MAKVIEVKTCEHCRFWETYDKKIYGNCHRYPPTAGQSTDKEQCGNSEDYMGMMINRCVMPYTVFDDWCGEWQGEATKLSLVLSASISEFGLRTIAATALESAGIDTVEKLLTYTPDSLLDIRNFGETSLARVREALAKHSLHLKGCMPIASKESTP